MDHIVKNIDKISNIYLLYHVHFFLRIILEYFHINHIEM